MLTTDEVLRIKEALDSGLSTREASEKLDIPRHKVYHVENHIRVGSYEYLMKRVTARDERKELVLQLYQKYLDGDGVKELSKESGVPVSVLVKAFQRFDEDLLKLLTPNEKNDRDEDESNDELPEIEGVGV